MRTESNVNPLIVNFMKPQQPQVVSADEVKVIYDPKSQITFFMGGGGSGGGGSRSRGTRSQDGYKHTKETTYSGYYEHNDAGRWTDD